MSVLLPAPTGRPLPPEMRPTAAAGVDRASWRAHAACQSATAAAFYPPSSTESREQRQRRESAARALCAGCAVRQTCLDYALHAEEPYGIWGGLNELERRRLLRSRAVASHAG